LNKLIDTKSEKDNIINRIQDFSDVLEIVGVSQDSFKKGCENLTEDEVAYKALKLITKAYNQGWKPNWKNYDEAKYYPWFKMTASASGSVAGRVVVDVGGSVVGRLVFKDRDGCMDAANKFLFV